MLLINKFKKGASAGYLLMAVLFICTYLDHFIVLVSRWTDEGKWKYLLLPFVALLTVSSIKRVRKIKRVPALARGVMISLLGCVVSLCSRFTVNNFLIEITPFIMLYGLLFLIEGKKRADLFAWPVWYFFFILVAAPAILPHVQYPLRQIGSVTAELILNGLGKEVIRYDTILHLPAIVLDINPWCSGINQLLSILTFTIPFAFFSFERNRARFLLIAISVVVSVTLNSVRIALLGIWNYDTVREHIHGPGDILLAPVIYPAALALLIFSRRIIRRYDTLPSDKTDEQNKEFHLTLHHFAFPALMLSLSILMSAIPFLNRAAHSNNPSQTTSVWTDSNGFSFELNLKWYPSQTFFNRIDTDFSRSMQLFPVLTTVMLADNRKFTVNKMQYSENDSITVILMYWYQTGGKKFGSTLLYTVNLFWNSVTRGDNSATITTLVGKCPSRLHLQLQLQRAMFNCLQKERLLE